MNASFAVSEEFDGELASIETQGWLRCKSVLTACRRRSGPRNRCSLGKGLPARAKAFPEGPHRLRPLRLAGGERLQAHECLGARRRHWRGPPCRVSPRYGNAREELREGPDTVGRA